MQRVDIRKVKNELRQKFKKIRSDMPEIQKNQKNKNIYDKIISLPEFMATNLVLTFVSTKIEVNTHSIIDYCFLNNKQVAVPKCFDGNHMEFYVIKSFNDLEYGKFSLLEPNLEKCKKLIEYKNSICFTPGLSFDMNGYRLGYGKGYYDRFFSKYNGKIVGICYSSCLQNKLPTGRYDKTVGILITDKFIKRFN